MEDDSLEPESQTPATGTRPLEEEVESQAPSGPRLLEVEEEMREETKEEVQNVLAGDQTRVRLARESASYYTPEALEKAEAALKLKPTPLMTATPEQRAEVAERMKKVSVRRDIAPQQEVTWDGALIEAEAMRKSDMTSPVLTVIYCDGRCRGSSRVDYRKILCPDGVERLLVVANLNHHSAEDAPGTRSTVIQALNMIVNGTYRHPDAPDAQTEVVLCGNDPDQDNIATDGAFRHASEIFVADGERLKNIDKFFSLQDELDCRAGLFKVNPELPLMRRMAYVFDGYMKDRRASTFIAKKDQNGMVQPEEMARATRETDRILDEGGKRLLEYCRGNYTERDVETHCKWVYPYDNHFRELGWGMVDEVGSGDYHRITVCNENLRGLITVRDQKAIEGEKSRRVVTVAKIGEDVVSRREQPLDFDLNSFWKYMNGVDRTRQSDWGGDGRRGGGPRAGTYLSRRALIWHMQEFLANMHPPIKREPIVEEWQENARRRMKAWRNQAA